MLLPLADNGGSTRTHAFDNSSPAFNSGDPSLANPAPFDQRGAPFHRVEFDRIDRGAMELNDAIDGDFDDDGDYDLADIDALTAAIVDQIHDPAFDLNQDTIVDLADRDAWLAEAGGLNLGAGRAYLVGDANLDAQVDGQDFLIWNSHKFTSGGLWSGADFDADGNTNGGDFILWNGNKFNSADSRSVRSNVFDVSLPDDADEEVTPSWWTVLVAR